MRQVNRWNTATRVFRPAFFQYLLLYCMAFRTGWHTRSPTQSGWPSTAIGSAQTLGVESEMHAYTALPSFPCRGAGKPVVGGLGHRSTPCNCWCGTISVTVRCCSAFRFRRSVLNRSGYTSKPDPCLQKPRATVEWLMRCHEKVLGYTSKFRDFKNPTRH